MFHDYITKFIQRYDLYDADVVVFQRGQIVAQEFIVAPDVPVQYARDALVRVASISKILVAMSIMQLVEQQKIALEDPVSNYLDFTVTNPRFPHIPITIKMLLTHTSSLCDTTQLYLPYGEHMKELFCAGGRYHSEELYLNEDGHYVKPGERFWYYNTGYQLLAAVIETVSQERFDQYVETHILNPLEIISTFDRRHGSYGQLVRPTYRKHNDQWVAQFDMDDVQPRQLQDYPLGTNGSLFGPQGGLRSNATQLSKLMAWMFDPTPRILTPQTLQQMMTIVVPIEGYTKPTDDFVRNNGLGFNIIPSGCINHPIADKQGTFVGHQGIAYGLHGIWFLDPISQNGLIFITSGHGKPMSEYQGRHSMYYSFHEDVFQYVNQNFWRSV